MELSWLMRLRIAAVAAVGIGLIGILAWPLAEPADPYGAVLFSSLSFGGVAFLVGMAFHAGLAAYFLAWPYGREIGILAVPAGLFIWAVRSGDVSGLLLQINRSDLEKSVVEHQALFASLNWEPLFWLGIVAVGFGGVLVGQKIARPKTESSGTEKKSNSSPTKYLMPLGAVLISIVIAKFFIEVFARDVSLFDNKLQLVAAQPTVGQIVFAVLVSFAIAAFVIKKLFNLSYIWPVVGSAFVILLAHVSYNTPGTFEHLLQRWPVVFFANAASSILPVQMVIFGVLGSIIGYWLAVRYDYWRHYELKQQYTPEA